MSCINRCNRFSIWAKTLYSIWLVESSPPDTDPNQSCQDLCQKCHSAVHDCLVQFLNGQALLYHLQSNSLHTWCGFAIKFIAHSMWLLLIRLKFPIELNPMQSLLFWIFTDLSLPDAKIRGNKYTIFWGTVAQSHQHLCQKLLQYHPELLNCLVQFLNGQVHLYHLQSNSLNTHCTSDGIYR